MRYLFGLLATFALALAALPARAQTCNFDLNTVSAQLNEAQTLWDGGDLQDAVALLGDARANLLAIESGCLATLLAETPVYQVAFVAEDDVLNIRSGPGAGNEAAGLLLPGQTDILITNPQEVADGGIWAEVAGIQFTGWVNRYFLTQQVDAAIFCNDPRVPALIDELIEAVRAEDGNRLQPLTQPERGLLVRRDWFNNEVRFRFDDVAGFFVDQATYDWGIADGSGMPLVDTTANIILPLLRRDFGGPHVVTCNEIVHGGTTGFVILPPEYEGINFYSIHRPPLNQDIDILDWGTWVVGVEYWDGQPSISFLVHYQWYI